MTLKRTLRVYLGYQNIFVYNILLNISNFLNCSGNIQKTILLTLFDQITISKTYFYALHMYVFIYLR